MSTVPYNNLTIRQRMCAISHQELAQHGVYICNAVHLSRSERVKLKYSEWLPNKSTIQEHQWQMTSSGPTYIRLGLMHIQSHHTPQQFVSFHMKLLVSHYNFLSSINTLIVQDVQNDSIFRKNRGFCRLAHFDIFILFKKGHNCVFLFCSCIYNNYL